MSRGKLIDSPEKFLQVVQKSQLLTPDDLAEFASGDEQGRDPVIIARSLIKQGKLTKWQASQLLSGYFQLMFGKYKLCDQIGKGELGSVYLAENAKLGRKVALKALSRKHTANPELVKRFLDEARAAAALDHRNIIHVHDVTSEGERHYVVMEYVAGQVLQAKVEADGPLPIDVAIACVRQAAEGMQYAHDQHVLHRDLKPANLMVDSQGTIKIMDVGVGQLRQSKAEPSAGTGEMMLAATDYQSPEQIRGGEVTARSDIYSLGGVLYFLLSGRAPFAAKNEEERERIKTTKQPVPLCEIVPSVPPRLSDLCQKLMEPVPENRPQSMAEVVTALDELTAVPADSAVETEAAEEQAQAETFAFPTIDTGEKAKAVTEQATADQAEAPDDEPATKSEESAAKASAPGDFLGLQINTGKPGGAAAGPMEFSLNTKRRKKTKAAPPPKPAKTEAKPAQADPEPAVETTTDATAEPAKPAESEGEKRRLPWGLIIGGVCAAIVLVLTGVGLAVLFMSGGKEPQVAKGPDKEAAAPANPQADTAGAGQEATPDATATGASETPVDAATAASDPTTAATDPAATKPAATTTDAAANATATSAPTASAPATAPTEVAPATTTPMPGTAPVASAPETPATPAPTASPAPATTPAEPAPKAEPSPPPKEEPKPEPKKEGPPIFVFEPAVDLPPVAADAPETLLGQVNIGPQDVIYITLAGGDTASKGKASFALQNAQSGVAPRDWEFFLDSGNGDPIVIATMSMPETELKFKWAATSTSAPAATNLRNCSLKISAGQGKPQEVALRKPQGIAPIPVVVDKKTSVKWVLEGAPDPESLRLEITVNGYKGSVEPSAIELGKKNRGEIFFGENREQAALLLRVEASYTGRNIELTFDPHFMVPVEKEPVRLNKAARNKYANIGNARAQLEGFILQYDKAPQDQKNQLQNQYLQVRQDLDMLDKTVAKMTQLDTDIAAVGAGGVTLQCRVYSDSIEKQIDLLVNDPNAPPADQ